MSDGFTCDASLMVENETLKKEVNELTLALGKAYGGDAACLCAWVSSIEPKKIDEALKDVD